MYFIFPQKLYNHKLRIGEGDACVLERNVYHLLILKPCIERVLLVRMV